MLQKCSLTKIKPITMNKIILIVCLFLCLGIVNGQGLENVIVEKYYVSNANDTIVNSIGGVLPVGSVTYRIYADMLPGFKFQAVFGVQGHEMRIETSTLFFNNEDRGATSPTYSKSQASDNTVMLDSWLSVGAACSGNFGILKANDDGVSNVVNSENPQVLQNADPSAGIPLTIQDGMVVGIPEPVITVGISTELAIFDNQNDGTNGPVFSSWDGSWASLNGSIGPDSIDNKVLIAQITTNGTFSFELNIQIGTPDGGTEQYVAKDPLGNEIQMASLTYSSLIDKIDEVNPVQAIMNIFPNPANELFSLEFECTNQSINNSYSIYDSKGSLITTKYLGKVSDKYQENINTSSWTKGQYIIQLSMDGALSTKKIIIN